MIEPSLLLLDEPLSNLDANLREQMRFEIRDIQQRIGITTVFVTHDQSEAIAAADRLVVMKSGAIRQIGTPRQIYESPADTFVADFIGKANLIDGRVGEICGSDATFEPAAGVGRARRSDSLDKGAVARLALRPEDIRLAPCVGGEDVNSLPATIERVTYLGAVVSVDVSVGGRALAVTVPRDQPLPAPGEGVFLQWERARGVLLAKGSTDD